MARDTTLVRLLDLVRHEARLSLNPAHNNQYRDHQVSALQREQERLWADHDWPHLRVERDITVYAGQRYFDLPSDLAVDRVEAIKVKSDGEWLTLSYGIGDGHYAAHDSDLDERSWPVQAWRIRQDGEDPPQIEVWPIPDQDTDATTGEATLRVVGIRKLRPLVADTDRADLDDRLLALYVAAGILAARGEKDAQFKLEMASKHMAALKGGLQKGVKIRMFGIGEDAPNRRLIINRYRPPVT